MISNVARSTKGVNVQRHGESVIRGVKTRMWVEKCEENEIEH